MKDQGGVTYTPDRVKTRPGALTFDPVSRKWVKGAKLDTREGSPASKSSPNKVTQATGGSVPTKSQKVSKSKKKADKEIIDQDFDTLTGELKLKPTKETMKLNVGDNIVLDGFGTYLSGTYLITGIKRTIDGSSGYSQTLTVTKTGFDSSSLKREVKKPKKRKAEVEKKVKGKKGGKK